MNSLGPCETFLNTKAVVESKQAIEANPEAKTLFDEYVAFQNKLQGLMQSGQLPTEAVQQEMKTTWKKSKQVRL